MGRVEGARRRGNAHACSSRVRGGRAGCRRGGRGLTRAAGRRGELVPPPPSPLSAKQFEPPLRIMSVMGLGK